MCRITVVDDDWQDADIQMDHEDYPCFKLLRLEEDRTKANLKKSTNVTLYLSYYQILGHYCKSRNELDGKFKYAM